MIARALAVWLVAALPLVAVAEGGAPPLFLVARPHLPDPNFRDAVVLLTNQDDDGASGVIVNRPTGVPLARVFPEAKGLAALDDKLFFGGPVARDVAVVIFRAPQPRAGAARLFEDVYIGSGKRLFAELFARDKPTQGLRVFAGVAGWGPGQLEGEIDRGDWRRLPADPRSIFDARPEALWRELDRRASAIVVRAGP